MTNLLDSWHSKTNIKLAFFYLKEEKEKEPYVGFKIRNQSYWFLQKLPKFLSYQVN